MDGSFFDAKRPWSKYKDLLLKFYLDPYIAKVGQLKKGGRPIPVLIVDSFAGRGRFADGSPGSPILIADAVRKWRGKGIDVSAQFIEADSGNFDALRRELSGYGDNVVTTCGTFEESLPAVQKAAERSTVFLYVDPFNVRVLDFAALKAVYDQIRKSDSSVEVLLNFNVAIFMRWALAALKRWESMPAASEFESMADNPDEHVERKTLTSIAGGDDWIAIAEDPSLSFQERLEQFLAVYTGRMQKTFKHVEVFGVRERYKHTVPKYAMIHGTRHDDGFLLMNDAMCKANRTFINDEFASEMAGSLSDIRPEEAHADRTLLTRSIKDLVKARGEVTRATIQVETLRHGLFGRVTKREINTAVSGLLKQNELERCTTSGRVNDEALLRLPSQMGLFG